METKVRVIGAGWGRTGTVSLKKALEILGFGPCYHMREVMETGDAESWTRYAENPKDLQLLHSMLGGKGYASTCDYPSSAFWKEQMELYPEAKVVLTIRDPEKWYKSVCDTVFHTQPSHPNTSIAMNVMFWLGWPTKGFGRMLDALIATRFVHGNWSKQNVLSAFHAHNNDVLRTCPKDKLLVFEVSQGWAPLCEFLDVTIPDVPFPHENETAGFQRMITRTQYMGYGVIAMAVVVLAVVVAAVMKCVM